MKILGLESSCDETAAAVVENGQTVLSSVISSQIKLHTAYGGVIPELAAREHLKNVSPVVAAALREADTTLGKLDGIAVTSHPGLIPALLVGNAYAKGLAAATGLPIVGVNHFLGHLYGAFLGRSELLQDDKLYPILGLVVSGGHTAIILVEASGKARILGRTQDDAAGEALDKAAKILNLGYPGGPVIDRLAKEGNPTAHAFPMGLVGAAGKPVPPEHRYDFSFSGVKTALLYKVRDHQLSDQQLRDLVASYQSAVMEVMVHKALLAARDFHAGVLCLCGGVACNSYLRRRIQEEADKRHLPVLLAPPKYCTDNAAMIGGVGYHYLRLGRQDSLDMPVNARLPQDPGIIPFAKNAK